MSEPDQLLIRIERLESQARNTRLVGGLSIFLVCIVALAVAVREPRTITIREVILKDDYGNAVARLGSSRRGTCLSLKASTKLASVDLCASNSAGATLYLSDLENHASAELSAGEMVYETGRMAPSLVIADGNANFARISVGDDTELHIEHGNGTSQSSAVLTSGKDKAAIQIFNQEGKVVWSAPAHN
jgi:hypothetical protein